MQVALLSGPRCVSRYPHHNYDQEVSVRCSLIMLYNRVAIHGFVTRLSSDSRREVSCCGCIVGRVFSTEVNEDVKISDGAENNTLNKSIVI